MDASTEPRPRSLLSSYLWLGLVALLLGTAYAIFLARSQRTGQDSVLAAPADSKERFGEIRPFTLVDSGGRKVSRESLIGRPLIVGFVFTRCTGPCPRITANMKGLHDRIGGEPIRLVTLTVDPEYDTSEVLAEHARILGADTERWWFLTGPPAEVREVCQKSFLSPMEKDASQAIGESITHRTYLVVVDKHGALRGFYDGEGAAGVDAALARARFLVGEP